MINREFILNFIKPPKKRFLIIGIFFIINLFFFDYSINFTGGGVFFQLSNFFFKIIIFFIYSFYFLMLIANFSKNSINNFLIFILLIISNIQNTIYHKYYDP